MSIWTQNIDTLKLDSNDKYLHWLTKPGKLTAHLQSLCQALTVRLITQQLGTATPDEQLTLNIHENNSFIREVHLCGDGIPWVHARVIIPHQTYLQHQDVLDGLGTKFLGEHFLYQQQNVTRSNFSYATVNNQFARRSMFYIAKQSLLVAEIFLPNVP